VREAAQGRPALVLAVCCLGLFITGLDAAGVTVALPAIGRALHAPVPGLQWVLDGYTLPLASLLLVSGSAADRFGRRRVFRAGLAAFAAATLACSLAPSAGWLIGARVVQGAAASLLGPPALGIIAATFPDPGRRARALGVWSAVYGAAMAAGPLAAGMLLAAAGWRAVFWVTVPVAAAALVLSAAVLPASRPRRGRRADPAGQVLVTVMMAALTYAIIGGPQAGWAAPRTLGAFLLTAGSAAGLAWHLPRQAQPLIDTRLFRRPAFTGAIAIAVCGLAAAGGFTFLATLYLQDARGWPPLAAGLGTLPMAVATMLLAPVSGRLAARGTRLPLTLSGIATLAGGLCLAGLTRHTPPGLLLAASALAGLGFSMVNAPVTATAIRGLPSDQAGLAGAVASASRQLGLALGVAAAGAALTATLHDPARAGLAEATWPGWQLIAGCGAAVTIVALTTVPAAATSGKVRASRKDRAAAWQTAAGPWLAGLLATGAVAARPLTAHGRVTVRAIAGHPRARPCGLLAAAGAAAMVCGALLQDTAADEETVHLNPRVAELLDGHLPPDAAGEAAGFSHLVQPPGLWLMAVIAVTFLNVKRRGRSTARIAASACGALGGAASVNAALPGWDGHQPASLGAAAVAALAVATVLFAGRWLDAARTGITTAVVVVAAAGLTVSLAIAGQPFTAVAAGACLGTAVAAAVDAAARMRWGRWLADPPSARQA
jgi:EmrB/QacA subfamily drug resistance transporter